MSPRPTAEMWRDQFRYSILWLAFVIFLLSCQETVNEEQCRTVHEEQCSTVYEEACSTSYQQQCSTQYEQLCATVTERQCSTQYEEQCEDVTSQECRTEQQQVCYNVPEEECTVGSIVHSTVPAFCGFVCNSPVNRACRGSSAPRCSCRSAAP